MFFFRWEDASKELAGAFPFVQVGFSIGGDLVSYANTLDITKPAINNKQYVYLPVIQQGSSSQVGKRENSVFAFSADQTTTSGVYVFANDGRYFVPYGPEKWWWLKSNEGYCGNLALWCWPGYMRYTYESDNRPASNGARWDNPDYWQTGTVRIFIPRVNATTEWANYYVNVLGGYNNYRVNQLAYYNEWLLLGNGYRISSIDLSDIPYGWQSAQGRKIGFDEVQIIY